MSFVGLEQLWELQRVRQQLLKTKRNLLEDKKIRELQKVKKIIKDMEEACRCINQDLDHISREIRKQEFNYEQKQATIKELSLKLYSGTVISPKELASLEQKLHVTEKLFKETEEEIINLTINQEQIEKGLLLKEKELETARSIYEEKKLAYNLWKSDLEETVRELKVEEDTIIADIDPDLYQQYQNLKAKYGNFVVAKLVGEICTGCHMKVSTGLAGKVAGKHLVKCENCGRILYRG